MKITHQWEPAGNHPLEGRLNATKYYLRFRFGGMPERISVMYPFSKMDTRFNYPVIISTQNDL